MELCKICAILVVLLVHSIFPIIGYPTHPSDNNVYALFWEALSVIGVNVFVLVTGYFSTVPRIKSIFNILFICLFYAILKITYSIFTNNFSVGSILFISKANWFVTAYLGLLLLTPALNYCSDLMSKKGLGLLVLCLLLFEAWFGFIPGYGTQHFSCGYSMLSFAILYLLARYIRLYGVPHWFVRWSGSLYFFFTLLISILAYSILKIGWRAEIMVPSFYDYTNPLIIISAVCFVLFFSKLRIRQSKIINHVAKSTLAVLLIHTMEPFTTWRKQFFTELWQNFTGLQLVIYYALGVVVIFIVCCLVDQTRLMEWKPIQKYLNKKVKRNEIF